MGEQLQPLKGEEHHMFRCEQCGSHHFKLMVQPAMAKQLQLWINDNAELLIQVGDRPSFVADLSFINRYATCESCEAIGQWSYWSQTSKTEG